MNKSKHKTHTIKTNKISLKIDINSQETNNKQKQIFKAKQNADKSKSKQLQKQNNNFRINNFKTTRQQNSHVQNSDFHILEYFQ